MSDYEFTEEEIEEEIAKKLRSIPSNQCQLCAATYKPHKWGAIKAHNEGWYMMKDGRSFCPDHRPPWAPPFTTQAMTKRPIRRVRRTDGTPIEQCWRKVGKLVRIQRPATPQEVEQYGNVFVGMEGILFTVNCEVEDRWELVVDWGMSILWTTDLQVIEIEEHTMVTCPRCKVTWDSDFDPPGCTNDKHKHTLDVERRYIR